MTLSTYREFASSMNTFDHIAGYNKLSRTALHTLSTLLPRNNSFIQPMYEHAFSYVSETAAADSEDSVDGSECALAVPRLAMYSFL
jgi:hypothetical protein